MTNQFSLTCGSGAYRYCETLGYSGGFVQGLTGKASVLCTSGDVQVVHGSDLNIDVFGHTGVCYETQPDWHPWSWLHCGSTASVCCQHRGFAGGGLMEHGTRLATVLCSN